MARLTDLLNRPDIAPYEKPCWLALSPNRTWLVWFKSINNGDALFAEAAHLDGTHFRPLNITTPMRGFFPDDQHWIEQPSSYSFKTQIADLLPERSDRRYLPNALQAKTIVTQEGEFASIEWLPGGKKVAVVYHQTLYVVPVK